MRKLNKQHYILIIVISICCFIGACAGLVYKQAQKETGIQVSITHYSVVKPQPLTSIDTYMQAHIITVYVTNKSIAAFNLLPSVFFQLVTNDKTYQLSPDMNVKNPLQGGEVAVNATASGEISFHVPSNIPGELQFRTSVNSNWVTIND